MYSFKEEKEEKEKKSQNKFTDMTLEGAKLFARLNDLLQRKSFLNSKDKSKIKETKELKLFSDDVMTIFSIRRRKKKKSG